MKILTMSVCLLAIGCEQKLAQAQGAFQNLDFESANLATIPAGQYGGFVSINDALPGWTGYWGTDQIATVLHNNTSLGHVSTDIIGPEGWLGLPTVIEGQYSVMLQAGFDGVGFVSASISQTGLVPASAQSLRFKGSLFGGQFEVTLGGQTISMIPLLTAPNYTLYAGNISAFAGQPAELTISALPGNSFCTLDSVAFSSSVVPEPSALSLLGLGLLGLGRQLQRKL